MSNLFETSQVIRSRRMFLAAALLSGMIGCGGPSGVGTIDTDAARQERIAREGRDFVAQPPTPAEIKANSKALKAVAKKGQVSPGG